MVNEKKIRIMITLPKDVDEEISALCSVGGQSKSAFIQGCISDKLYSFKMQKEIAEKMVSSFAKEAMANEK